MGPHRRVRLRTTRSIGATWEPASAVDDVAASYVTGHVGWSLPSAGILERKRYSRSALGFSSLIETLEVKLHRQPSVDVRTNL